MSFASRCLLTLGLYAFATAAFAGVQFLENRRSKPGDPFWAPVWWIALTWPFWLVVVAFDLRVEVKPPRH